MPGTGGCTRPGSRRGAAGSRRRRSVASAGWLTSRCSPVCGWTTSSATTSVVTLDRLTLTEAFGRAGWRTVCWSPRRSRRTGRRGRRTTTTTRSTTPATSGMPGRGSAGRRCPTSSPSPRSSGWSSRQADRPPIMAEVSLVSSHWPWTPMPRLVDWNLLGDGSIFDPMAVEADSPRGAQAGHPSAQGRLRPVHRLLLGRADLVGAAAATTRIWCSSSSATTSRPRASPARGPAATSRSASSRRDPAVTDRIAGWGWQEGLRPDADGTGVADGRLPGQVPHRLRHRLRGPV